MNNNLIYNKVWDTPKDNMWKKSWKHMWKKVWEDKLREERHNTSLNILSNMPRLDTLREAIAKSYKEK